MNPILLALLAMFSALSAPPSDPVPTSTGIVAAQESGSTDVSLGATVDVARPSVAPYLAGSALVGGVVGYQLGRSSPHRPSAVPEPASLAVLGVGVCGLVHRGRARR